MISLRGDVENNPENERPVRGDNRTGQAIWALGVDGRSRRIQPRWGGMTAPTNVGRGRVVDSSNRARIFLTSWQGFRKGNHCAAARLASPGADLSDAMAAGGWIKALVAGSSRRSATFSGAGVPRTGHRPRCV